MNRASRHLSFELEVVYPYFYEAIGGRKRITNTLNENWNVVSNHHTHYLWSSNRSGFCCVNASFSVVQSHVLACIAIPMSDENRIPWATILNMEFFVYSINNRFNWGIIHPLMPIPDYHKAIK